MLNKAEIQEVAAMMGHTISGCEVAAIHTVCDLGNKYGYGNLIGWLSTAWATMLVRHYGFAESVARDAVHGTPYLLPTSGAK